MDTTTVQQHRELDHYYTVQIEAEMQAQFDRTIADLKLAMTEAMTSIRLGVADFAYQRLNVALERLDQAEATP